MAAKNDQFHHIYVFTCRHVGMLEESEFVLKEAQSIYRDVWGEVSEEVADTLTALSSTYNNRGTHNKSRYGHSLVPRPDVCKRFACVGSGDETSTDIVTAVEPPFTETH